MGERYEGRAALRPCAAGGEGDDDPVRVEIEVAVTIDDVGAADWVGTVVAAGEFASYLDRRVHVVLLAGAARGRGAEAVVDVLSPTEVRLLGTTAFA
jgi:hypothetical protein